MATQDRFLIELQEIHQKVIKDRGQLSPEARKRFWRISGAIKREPSPNPELVEIATEIRDTLYLHRPGSTKPMSLVMPLWTICGIGVIVCPLLFTIKDLTYFAVGLSWLFVTVFMLGW